MFVNDIFKKKQLDEGGPFRSTEPKKPRKGSVADLAAQKRKEQERGRQPIEPKDQRVGVARVVKEYGDTKKGQKQLTRVHKRAVDRLIKADDKNMLEPDYTKRDLKTVRKNQATADRAWDRFTDMNEQGLAEGISVVDQDYDLDQMHLTLDIEGKKVYFTYWDYEEDFSNAERRDVFDQLQEQPWYKGLDHPTKMEILDAAYRALRGLEPQEYRPTVGDEPLDEQGVAEGSIYKKDQDLSSIPTQELEAFVRKHWFGGIPTYGQGESVKRAMRELRRRQKQGVAEGSLEEYGDTDRGQKMLGKVQTRAVKRIIKHLDDPNKDFELAKKNRDNAERAYARMKNKGVSEGSAAEKLDRRFQELRKKRGAPDPEYYKELKASYDLPDAERYAKQKEIKQKYKVTNEDRERYIEELGRAGYEIVNEKRMTCPECGGAAYADQMLAEKQDACYHKVKSRYKVWPSAYASGALVRCRKKGAKNWGNKSK